MEKPIRSLYNLDVVSGYRVKAAWHTVQNMGNKIFSKEYMKKGFAMDDEQLKNLGGRDYFKELFLTNRRWIKATDEYRKYKAKTLSDVERDYLN